MWVFGKPDIDAFMAWAPSMCLDGVVDKITVPFSRHAMGRVIVRFPSSTRTKAMNRRSTAPKRELHIFTPDDYAIEHCEGGQRHRGM